ncbi:MAG: DNA-directed RNA polymerase subunit omega [Acidobacteriota bacterium]
MYKFPENIDSKFRFVTIMAMRAKQLQRGAPPRVETTATKPTAIAREEVLAGAIDFQVGEEALGPMDGGTLNEFLEG